MVSEFQTKISDLLYKYLADKYITFMIDFGKGALQFSYPGIRSVLSLPPQDLGRPSNV